MNLNAFNGFWHETEVWKVCESLCVDWTAQKRRNDAGSPSTDANVVVAIL